MITPYLGGDPIATTVTGKIQLPDVLVQESDYGSGICTTEHKSRQVPEQKVRYLDLLRK